MAYDAEGTGEFAGGLPLPGLRDAWVRSLRLIPGPQALLLGWVLVWAVTELLVISISPVPGRPIWLLLHAGYFLGASCFEIAMLRMAIASVGNTKPDWKQVIQRHDRVLIFTLVKIPLLIGFLVGCALLLLPGLWLAARFGSALFFCQKDGVGSVEALRMSYRHTRGRSGILMGYAFLVLLLNLLGAALLGVGLLLSVPVTALLLAEVHVRLVAEQRERDAES